MPKIFIQEKEGLNIMLHDFFQSFNGMSGWWLVPVWLFCARLAASPFWKEIGYPEPRGSVTFRVIVWLFVGAFMMMTGLGINITTKPSTISQVLEIWFYSMSFLGTVYLIPNILMNTYFQDILRVVFLWDFSVFKRPEKVSLPPSKVYIPTRESRIATEYEQNLKKIL